MHDEHGPWACLMYHGVPAPGAPCGYFDVPRATFAQQLDAIRELGLVGTSLEALLAAPPARAVAITFDDAERSNSTEAVPELLARGMRGTFFVVTSWVGRAGTCSWSDLREMHDAGMSIQSHTRTHPFLSTLPDAEAREECRRSREELEQHLGAGVTTLSLPNGDAPASWRAEAFGSLGYQRVATSAWGPNLARPAVVRRYTVRAATTLPRFRELATARAGAWDREGLRLTALHQLRAAIGPHRYARWRRRALAILQGDR